VAAAPQPRRPAPGRSSPHTIANALRSPQTDDQHGPGEAPSRCASFVAGSSVDGWSDTATIGTGATYVAPSMPRSRPGAGRNLQRAQLRSAGRGRAPVRRHRPHRRRRHRPLQPAEHHGVAEPAIHGGQPPLGGLPSGARPLRLRCQRRRASRGRRCAAQLAAAVTR
jgi:hypothetical protein